MTNEVKRKLIEYIYTNCASTPFLVNGLNRGYFRCDDVREAIRSFDPEPTEGCTCGTENAKLQKELDYWKCEHASLREHNIKLEAIIHTIEQLTGKNFLG